MTEGTFKLFDLYDVSTVQIKDPALKPYINLIPRLLLKTHGRDTRKFSRAKIHIVERIANRIGVPGHVGKKHKVITGWASGKYNKNMKTVLEVLKIIEAKTRLEFIFSNRLDNII